MILKEFRDNFNKQLESIYPKTEIDSFFFLLTESYLNFQRVDLVLKASFFLDEKKVEIFLNALQRLKQQEPIQHIIGKTEFYGLPFFVNQHTLIPRPETEELVSWILKIEEEKREKRKEKSLKILDIGTGTGCIPISLKNELPTAQISAIDISKETLKIAKKNAELNKVEVNYVQKDILKTDSLNDSYDIIISNPPYVRELEKKMMQKNVLDFEPETALFVKDSNPLVFYKKITELAKNHLNQNGFLFFEINEYLGKETKELIENFGFSKVEIKNDIFGKQRMIKASL